jgi:hypothetical protein
MTPAQRQDYVIKLMLAGKWKGGRSRRALAAKWGVHERTVGDDAVVASAVLSRRGKPIEELIDSKYAELEGIQAEALRASRPDFNAAIKAIQLQMDIRGVTTKAVRAPKGEETTDGAYEKLSAEQRIAMHKAAIAEEESKLKGGMH